MFVKIRMNKTYPNTLIFFFSVVNDRKRPNKHELKLQNQIIWNTQSIQKQIKQRKTDFIAETIESSLKKHN